MDQCSESRHAFSDFWYQLRGKIGPACGITLDRNKYIDGYYECRYVKYIALDRTKFIEGVSQCRYVKEVSIHQYLNETIGFPSLFLLYLFHILLIPSSIIVI
jgi:hypothetical protein